MRTKTRAAEEYGLERRTKYYPKRRLLPQFEEAALKIKRRPTPRRQHTAARGCAQDQHYIPNNNITSIPDASADKNRVYKPWCNKYKRPKAKNGAQGTAINTGARNPQPVQREKRLQHLNPGPSSLNRILDRPCQIHGTPGAAANHTNRECWVFKQIGRAAPEGT